MQRISRIMAIRKTIFGFTQSSFVCIVSVSNTWEASGTALPKLLVCTPILTLSASVTSWSRSPIAAKPPRALPQPVKHAFVFAAPAAAPPPATTLICSSLNSASGNMTQQKSYRIGQGRSRRKRHLKLLGIAVQADAAPDIVSRCLSRFLAAKQDIRNISARALQTRSVCFNLNAYSEEQALQEFRFRKRDVGHVCNAIGWTGGRTNRSRYSCHSITACCILLRRLSSPSKWYDVELVFGIRYSHLSEIFWEVLEHFVECKGHLVTNFQEGLLRSRAQLYAKAVRDAGEPLESYVGFIDCTKIKIARPSGDGSF